MCDRDPTGRSRRCPVEYRLSSVRWQAAGRTLAGRRWFRSRGYECDSRCRAGGPSRIVEIFNNVDGIFSGRWHPD
jgi:hypothetical protein